MIARLGLSASIAARYTFTSTATSCERSIITLVFSTSSDRSAALATSSASKVAIASSSTSLAAFKLLWNVLSSSLLKGQAYLAATERTRKYTRLSSNKVIT